MSLQYFLDPCLGRGGSESPVHHRDPQSDRAEQQGLRDRADSEGRQVRVLESTRLYNHHLQTVQTFLFANECAVHSLFFLYIIRKCVLKKLSRECQLIVKSFPLTVVYNS